jgi:hypothetical protein
MEQENKKTTINITAEEGRVFKCVIKDPDFASYAKALNILNSGSEDGVMKLIEAGDSILLNNIVADESDAEILSRPDLRAMAAQVATGLIKIWNTDVKKS